MSGNSIVPETWDVDWLIETMVANGVQNHYGYGKVEDGYLLRYSIDDYDLVQAAIEAYPTRYAEEVLKPKMKREATDLRKATQLKPVNFNGLSLETDVVTISLITAAAYLMDANPNSAQTRLWKVNEDDWVELDRNTLVAMGEAIANYVQTCFQREKELRDQITAATTIEELAPIDVTTGWPA